MTKLQEVRSLEEALAAFRDETVQELKICNDIGVKGAKHIADALKKNTSLTALNLGWNTTGVKGAKHIAEALQCNKTLTKLNLRTNNIRNDGAKYIVEALKDNTTLTTLKITDNNICNEGAKHIADVLKHNTTFTTLNLECNYFGVEGAKHIADALKYNTSLTALTLGHQIGDEGAKHIAEALKHNTTLTTLNLEKNAIGDEGANHIAEALKHKTPLKTLNLSENRIGNEGFKLIAAAVEHNKTLTILDLHNNNIRDEGIKHFADALKQNATLTTVNLRSNFIGGEGAEHVGLALKQNKTLTILDLAANQISAHGATQLVNALKDNTTLVTLDLRENWFGAEGSADANQAKNALSFLNFMKLVDIIVHDRVSNVLKCNATFETLDLGGNEIGDEGAKHVAEALKHNSTFTTLDLSYDQIGVEGAKCIADALKYNKTLTTLDLEDNEIGYEGAKHIADALKHNTTLTTLDLNGNEIGDEGAKYVCDAINESIAARRRLFQWPKPPVNRKRKHSSSKDPAHLTKRLAIECSVCLEQKDQLHLLPCLHSVCEQCIHDIAAISPCVCRECQEPFSSTFLFNNVVGAQTAIHCPQHTANNATTFCSDCHVLVCIACEHNASHHLDELDEAIKKMQINLPPILDDLLMQLDQINEAIEYIAFARSSVLKKLESIKSSIQLSFEALNNEKLTSQRDALFEQAQVIAGNQDKILDLQSEDLKAAKDAREVALQQVRALVIGGIDHLQKYSVIRSRTNLLLKNLPELEPLVFDLLRFEQVYSQQVGCVFEYEPSLQVSYAEQEVEDEEDWW